MAHNAWNSSSRKLNSLSGFLGQLHSHALPPQPPQPPHAHTHNLKNKNKSFFKGRKYALSTSIKNKGALWNSGFYYQDWENFSSHWYVPQVFLLHVVRAQTQGLHIYRNDRLTTKWHWFCWFSMTCTLQSCMFLLRFIFETRSVTIYTMDYQAALDYTGIMPLPPESWDHKHESSCPELCIIY